MLSDELILRETGCRRDQIRKETVSAGSMPGLILTRHGNEYLCEEGARYLDNSPECHPTGRPEDYVLVTIPQG